jgi:Rrf2 family protein
MKYSKATNYALHTMLHLVASPAENPVGVQQLAEIQQVSQTYLSKILTKLVKAGMIESASGAGGGYKLIRRKEDISFLDVIHAIEGTASLFHCGLEHNSEECLIQGVMVEAEQTMEQVLRERKLISLVDKVQVVRK